MRYLKYLAAQLVPVVVLLSMVQEGWLTFYAPVVIFLLFPLLEIVLGTPTDNLTAEQEREIARDRKYDYVIYAMVPIQYALLLLFLFRVGGHGVGSPEFWGLSLSMGMACGVLGINVGHELGHRRKKSEQNMAKALLATSLYTHFFIEHNRGHHANVATENDPATSRYGESLFAFFPRTIWGSLKSAWHLEAERLGKQGKSPWTWQNEMLRYQVYHAALLAGIALAFGPLVMAAFCVAALAGALLLETVNYIEHYGLTRKMTADGRYERVLPIHSWNSNHVLGRLMLFELTRHSDHHANARRPYPVLRHFDESPQLPLGYPGMMVMAWFPPLWFAVMHRHIERHRAALQDHSPDATEMLAA